MRLSVIVPTYNGVAFLKRTLDSLVADADVEVIAVDDGSTDDTRALLESYRGRLDLHVHVRKVGNWAANSNYGLEQAHGEFACFLHQDDFWLPGRTAAVRRQLALTPDVTLLLHASVFADPAGRALGPWRCPLPPRVRLSPTQTLEHLLVQNFVAIPAAVFRRETALAVGGLDPALWYTADWSLWLKLAEVGPTVYLPGTFAAFRIHPASQTADRSRSLDAFRDQLETVLRAHAGHFPADSAVCKAARASIEVNVGLAAGYHRQPVAWSPLAASLGALGPDGWRRLLRDARLWERVSSRARAGFIRGRARA
jgi:glycosyltransferase involved in cell wall biosynthesis